EEPTFLSTARKRKGLPRSIMRINPLMLSRMMPSTLAKGSPRIWPMSIPIGRADVSQHREEAEGLTQIHYEDQPTDAEQDDAEHVGQRKSQDLAHIDPEKKSVQVEPACQSYEHVP